MDDSKGYRTLDSETKFEGKVFKVLIEKVEMPHGEICEREVILHKGAVGLVTVLADQKVVLVRQYRHPVGKKLVEIPAGKLAQGEDPQDCARRELKEETGYTANKLIKLTQFYTTPGYSNEWFHMFLAADVVKGKRAPEGGEEQELEVLEIPLSLALQQISAGEITDGKTIVGLCLAQRYLNHSG